MQIFSGFTRDHRLAGAFHEPPPTHDDVEAVTPRIVWRIARLLAAKDAEAADGAVLAEVWQRFRVGPTK